MKFGRAPTTCSTLISFSCSIYSSGASASRGANNRCSECGLAVHQISNRGFSNRGSVQTLLGVGLASCARIRTAIILSTGAAIRLGSMPAENNKPRVVLGLKNPKQIEEHQQRSERRRASNDHSPAAAQTARSRSERQPTRSMLISVIFAVCSHGILMWYIRIAITHMIPTAVTWAAPLPRQAPTAPCPRESTATRR